MNNPTIITLDPSENDVEIELLVQSINEGKLRRDFHTYKSDSDAFHHGFRCALDMIKKGETTGFIIQEDDDDISIFYSPDLNSLMKKGGWVVEDGEWVPVK